MANAPSFTQQNPIIVHSSVYNCMLVDSIVEMHKLCWPVYPCTDFCVVTQELNCVQVYVEHTSKLDLIMRDLRRAMFGYIAGPVGPHPADSLTEAELASDAAIKADKDLRVAAAAAEYELKAKAKREAFDAKMLNAPEIEIINEEAWTKVKEVNSDGYGAGIIAYAEWWARLMQIEIANGKQLADIVDATSHEADIEGITGFMYGAAVSILSQVWKHGEALCCWHNLKRQIGDEGERANESGGTLNPAILTIG